MDSGTNSPNPSPAALPAVPLEIRQQLNAIYSDLAAEVAQTGVVCRSSGNCCNFDEIDHILFASTLELTNLLTQSPVTATAFRGKLCPYWLDRKCTARDDRPLGCRVFFCDENYQAEHSQRLYEKYHRRIEALCEEWAAESATKTAAAYAYLPMVAALKHMVTKSRFFDPDRPLALLTES